MNPLQTTQTKQVEVRRTLKAALQQVFDAWTRPELVALWWGPEGFTTTITELDLRIGGRFCFEMYSPKGSQSTMAGVYQVVAAPHRLAFTMSEHCMCELPENVQPQRTPTLVVVNFHEVAPQRSEVVIHHTGLNPSFAPLVKQGWPSSLTKLGAVVEHRPPQSEQAKHSGGGQQNLPA